MDAKLDQMLRSIPRPEIPLNQSINKIHEKKLQILKNVVMMEV
jgi:hypothetical protein